MFAQRCNRLPSIRVDNDASRTGVLTSTDECGVDTRGYVQHPYSVHFTTIRPVYLVCYPINGYVIYKVNIIGTNKRRSSGTRKTLTYLRFAHHQQKEEAHLIHQAEIAKAHFSLLYSNTDDLSFRNKLSQCIRKGLYYYRLCSSTCNCNR